MSCTLARAASAAVLAILAGACATASSSASDEGAAAAPAPAARPVPAAPAPWQQAADSGAFVVRMGSDTLALERYTRTGDRLEGELVVRSPRTAVRRYTATLRPDGSIARFEVSFLAPGASAPTQRAVADLGGDTATVTITADSTRTLRVATGGTALPLLGNSFALYEQATMQARAAGADSLRLVLLPLGANQTLALTLSRLGRDSMLISNIAGTWRARVDARGRLLGLNGLESTQKVLVERVAALDLPALAAAFASRDASGQGMGQLSPRDTARATVGGASVVVDYGRPARRGRVVFGQVVPWGRVWRTGANQATHLRTDRDLVIGGTPVPAGAYTLWTLPSPQGWKLIVNRQTGQWGTEYDAERDLARIDMTRETLSAPVELFTIAVEPRGAGGVLAMSWDDTRVWVPIAVR